MKVDQEMRARFSDDRSNLHQTKQVPVLDVRRLFDKSNEVRSHHCSEEYRLMLAKNNKLILTK
jgi:hemin uptake protein HemP